MAVRPWNCDLKMNSRPAGPTLIPCEINAAPACSTIHVSGHPRPEICLRVVATKIVASGPDLPNGVHRLTILRKVDAFRELLRHAELVDIHHEFFIGRDQAAFEPSRRMQHEVRAGKKCRIERIGTLVGSLCIGYFGCAE